jgi:predicted DNA-binding transcriptional regulator AlpA
MYTPALSANDRALDLEGVCEITTCSRPYIYRLVAEGRFPKPKKIGRKNIWMHSTVLNWLRDQGSA